MFVSAPLTTLALVSSAPASDYEYTAVASDVDGDTLTYQLVASPIGMTIDAITGRVRWYVDSSRAGTHAVTIRANDGFGGVADQSFTLDVTLANGTPRILSAPLSYGRSGIPYRYQVLADDPDGDPIAFQLLRGPAGMTVDASGLISWPLPNVGTELVVVSVSDPSGRTVRQSYSLVITMPNAPRCELVRF